MAGRKKRPPEQENTDRWVVSYADFITLMFAFFVTMYALSRVDVDKVALFEGSVKSALRANPEPPAVGKPGPVIEGVFPASPDMVGIEKDFRKIIETLPNADGVSLEQEQRGLVVSIGERVLFESGQAQIRPEAKPSLDAIAFFLSGLSNNILVEGHTDNVPITSAKYESNWELSTERATQVLRYMVEYRGLSAARVAASGYAEYKPVVSNETPEGRAKNRRVDVVILKENGKAKNQIFR